MVLLAVIYRSPVLLALPLAPSASPS